MPFVAPKTTSSTAGSGAGGSGRTTFRPPWVKEDVGPSSKPNTVPWAKKTTTPTSAAAAAAGEKENGEKSSALKKPTTTTKANETTPAKPSSLKKPIEPVKKVATPPNKTVETAPIKKPTTTTTPANFRTAPAKSTAPATATTTTTTPSRLGAKKKEPTPSSSSSSEEEETEEEETEEEDSDGADDGDDFSLSDFSEPINQPFKDGPVLKPVPKQAAKKDESELQRRFSIEKPKLRPVMVKRDKSMKKVEDDDDVVEDETEEERESRLRFKIEKPKLRHVKREEKPLPSKSTENILKIRPTLKKVPKVDELLKEPKEEPKPEFKTKTLRKAPSMKREQSIKNVPAPPPLPSLVPKAPPPPPGAPGSKQPLTETKKATLDKLRSRPRRRPDWSEMMKEVEDGRKLKHVQCNDRSQPILTCKSMTKVDNKFIYETEKDNSHNKLLKQIQSGIRLKPTRTNDRSKPFIEGLRKFRRQMTIEEQVQKSQSKINMLSEAPSGKDLSTAASGKPSPIISAVSIEESSGDELDDIDKIRDDLQSTKQMLALELRNREAQERENKKLLAKIATLEAELEREKSREKNLEYGSNVIIATMDAAPHSEQLYLNSLKQEAEGARKTAKELETKYLDTGELLDQAKIEIEEQKRQIQMLERKLGQALQGEMTPNAQHKFNFRYAYEDPDDFGIYYDGVNGIDSNAHNHNNHIAGQKGGGSLNGSRRPSDAHTGRESDDDFDVQLSESDPDEPEEKKAERRERRLGKEVKVLRSKLTKLKVKQEAAKKEKSALKQAMKKNHVILKEENKKFKKLEKEVQKMAASMKEEDVEDKDDDEEEEEAAEEEEEEEESDEESEESESEESEEETESESEAEDSTNAAKKTNLEPRVKKHEGRLSAIKKCNVLLQANVDNWQDKISQVRYKAANLQSELDAVLADLGF